VNTVSAFLHLPINSQVQTAPTVNWRLESTSLYPRVSWRPEAICNLAGRRRLSLGCEVSLAETDAEADINLGRNCRTPDFCRIDFE
jgi:hypothetical protein